MQKKPLPITLRLTTLPAFAALLVVLIAGLSLVDLKKWRKGEATEDQDVLQVLKRESPKGTVPISRNIPTLSEGEALKLLDEAPTRAAVGRLWRIPKHRDRLFKLLLKEDLPKEVRVYLLGAFLKDSPDKALEAARSIASEKDLKEGPLLLSAFEILSRSGEKEDLKLFTARPWESHQLKTLREKCRDSLQRRFN
jgi:hypothetical protein